MVVLRIEFSLDICKVSSFPAGLALGPKESFALQLSSLTEKSCSLYLQPRCVLNPGSHRKWFRVATTLEEIHLNKQMMACWSCDFFSLSP